MLKETKKSKWLETHIWNSKRMHMQDIWGYRLVSSSVLMCSMRVLMCLMPFLVRACYIKHFV